MKLRIEAWGDTEGDLELAVEQVCNSIQRGNTSGMDGNETGGYHFEIDPAAPRVALVRVDQTWHVFTNPHAADVFYRHWAETSDCELLAEQSVDTSSVEEVRETWEIEA